MQNIRPNIFLIIVSVIIIGAIALIVFSRPYITNRPPTGGQPTVAATFLPVADIAQQIGSLDFKVVTLLPPGASPHTFEPTPAQIQLLQDVKTVFAVGHGIDDWSQALVNNTPGVKLFVVDQGIVLRHAADGTVDPHYWLDAKNGKIMARSIENELARLEPAKSQVLNQRLQNYLKSLDVLDGRIKELFKTKTDRNIVTHHDAWEYFAAAYGLKVVGVVEPVPGRELSPGELAALEKVIRRDKIKTIFSEPELSDQILKPLAKDTGVAIQNTDPEGGSDGIKSYEDILFKNAETIAQSLN